MLNIDKTNLLLSTLLVLIMVFSTPACATNGALLELLKILHDKGTLTAQEYDLLVTATNTNEPNTVVSTTSHKEEIKQVIAEEIALIEKPHNWVNKIQLKGDIRTRYQGQWEDGAIDRHRGRIRYRLGVIANPVERFEVGAGLASGSNDLRSTNQSFDETFSRKNINLDYAYVQYAFNDNVKAIAGKLLYKDYLYKATDLTWDNDINPEGFSLNYSSVNDLGTTFVNGGVWVLEENSSSEDDPFLAYGQLGQKFNLGAASATLAGTYYEFREINTLGNIMTDGTNTDYQFDSFSLSGDLTIPGLLGAGSKVSIIADWVGNIDTDTSQDTGYAVGFVAANGPWDFTYLYADLEENAWPDILSDSDRFDGLTGVHGHEFMLNYLAWKNVSLGLDYYLMENTADIDQNLLQLDVTVKF